MPELPEVETARRQLEKALLGHRLVRVVVDPRDRIAFAGASATSVQRALRGARVTGTGRRGKYFWIELNRKPWPLVHLGMSGNIEIRGTRGFNKTWGGIKLWSSRNKADVDADVPPYCRLLLVADNGAQVAMTDPRRFGRIRLVRDPLREPPLSRLGADPLEAFPSARELRALFERRRTPIKSLLLDQRYFAGVGNWLADEILFQSALSPHRAAMSLTPADIRRLRTNTLGVIRKAVRVDADYQRFPKSWLFHDRWNKGRESYTSRGDEIRHDTIGGRTTAWVPSRQR